jgi:hypothetical protein
MPYPALGGLLWLGEWSDRLRPVWTARQGALLADCGDPPAVTQAGGSPFQAAGRVGCHSICRAWRRALRRVSRTITFAGRGSLDAAATRVGRRCRCISAPLLVSWRLAAPRSEGAAGEVGDQLRRHGVATPSETSRASSRVVIFRYDMWASFLGVVVGKAGEAEGHSDADGRSRTTTAVLLRGELTTTQRPLGVMR